MKAAIVYASTHHRNTRRVAEAMAAPLGAALYSLDDFEALAAQSFDLMGLGSGIYFGRHHAGLRRLVAELPALPPRCFVFSTAGTAALYPLWHRSLIRRIQGRKSEVIGQFCCPGWDTVGPLALFGGLHRGRPNQADLARAADFARGLARCARA